MFFYRKYRADVYLRKSGSKYIVLIGTSVGKAWEFLNLQKKIELDEKVVTGYRGIYTFDKNVSIKNICKLPIPIEGVIIKEYAAYFPNDTYTCYEQNKKMGCAT